MMESLRRKLSGIINLLAPHRRKKTRKRAAATGCGAIKGSMRNVIVVRPTDGVFSEAVFVLRDDYFSSPGISREALLCQARAAAEEYTRTMLPTAPRGAKGALSALALLMLAAAVVAALYIR